MLLSHSPDFFLFILFFGMLQLRTVTLLLVAVSGSAFALGPSATLEIVSKEIAPDGFLRP